MQKLSVQASRGQPTAPFTPRDAQRPGAGQNPGIYPMSESSFEAMKKTAPCSPIEVNGRSASTGKCLEIYGIDATGIYEKLTKSSQSICDK